ITKRRLLYCVFTILSYSLIHVLAGTESSTIRQESGLMSGNVGDTVILHCFHECDMAAFFLLLVQSKPWENATFNDEFKDHVRISDMQLSDSGTYYCGSSYSNKMEFGEGAILIVEVKEKQSVSESVQPGDSVQYCTIHTETCAGEHCVYWFRHGSGESRPGIIYTHGDRSDQCEKTPEALSPTQSCIYNLPKRNLSLSDAGIYYCAVVSCWEILFGKGTKLDYGCKEDLILLLYCLGVALALCVILILVLCCLVYKMTKKTSLLCRGYYCPQCMLKLLVQYTLHVLVMKLS
uniref:Ig-like domain-containing protein n=1 Tax=Hucho hucho TaxID=62062 RepID=A0A4W5JN01_9TELE